MGLVKVGNYTAVKAETEKAIKVVVGRTNYNEMITTWYPKSVVKLMPTPSGYDVYVPEEMNAARKCTIASPIPEKPKFIAYNELGF